MSSSKRIEWLDIAKGIGIFLVVYAHARAPYSSYIYNFHMPFFFLISGVLYKSGGNLKQYIFKKIKTLYIPFVGWNLIFIIGKSLIRHENISPGNIFRVFLTLDKDGEFLGAIWYLASLFIISVVYKIIDYSILDSPAKKYIILGTFFVWCLIGFEISLPHMLSRTLICGFFYALGAFGKKYLLNLKLDRNTVVYAVISAGTFLVIGHYNSANMGDNVYRYKSLFLIGAVLASFATLCISKCIEEICRNNILSYVKKAVCFIGRNSIDIVIWQFIAFRAVIAVQLLINHIPLNRLLEYYPLYSEKNGWWIIYTIVGIVLPIIWGMFLRAGIWGKILRKIHMVN